MSAVRAVVQAGGAEVPRLMDRVEERMAELAGAHGPVLARHAGDTADGMGCVTAIRPVDPARGVTAKSMIRKSGSRFSEKIMLHQNPSVRRA